MNTNKVISWMSAILVLFLAGAAFVLSYDALHGLALDNGIKPSLAWLWPLCLDAFMVTASLAVLRASLNAEGKTYQWALVGAFTIASIVFNVVHAPATLLARSIYALPPLVVFLAFELLMKQSGATVKRNTAVQSIATLTAEAETKRAEVDALGADVNTLTGKRDALKTELATLRKEKRSTAPATTGDKTRERARVILAERGSISGAELGRELGRSESLGRKLKRELLPVSDNGKDAGVTQ